jgi:tRNA pseudouridine(55) synthase
MDKLINYYKKIGQTPLDCIKEIRRKNNKLENMPITYAGRLDPLAEGVLLLLVGDECQNKDEYLKLPKEYELTVLFGFSTDTYDLLGKVTSNNISSKTVFERSSPARQSLGAGGDEGGGSRWETSSNTIFDSINTTIRKFTGQINQKYPPYSSRTVSGRPLFAWAREGKLNEIEIPTHKVIIDNIEIIREGNISGEEILEKVKVATEIVKGDFRQKEIFESWQKEIRDIEKEIFKTMTLKISSGSGFYARSLAHEIGQEIGVPALAYQIVRTKVGDYTIEK